jgi:hypothetical protein
MPPAASTPLHRLLRAVCMVLNDTRRPRRALAWHLVFVDDGAYTLAFDGRSWVLTNGLGHGAPEVTVTTSTDAWTHYLMTPAADRPSEPAGVELAGTRRAVERFTRLPARFPDGTDEVASRRRASDA